MTHCSDPSCKDGNCEGCKNGELWCQDPRCDPHCRECNPPDQQEVAVNWVFGIVIALLIIIILMLILARMYDLI